MMLLGFDGAHHIKTTGGKGGGGVVGMLGMVVGGAAERGKGGAGEGGWGD
jgi:hypothetical protein